MVKALGADTGISKSEVSRICAELDVEVAAFRDPSLAEQLFRYVFLDATYCKARVNHRVVSQAVVVATTPPTFGLPEERLAGREGDAPWRDDIDEWRPCTNEPVELADGEQPF